MRQSALRDKLLHGSGKRFVALAMTLGSSAADASSPAKLKLRASAINIVEPLRKYSSVRSNPTAWFAFASA